MSAVVISELLTWNVTVAPAAKAAAFIVIWPVGLLSVTGVALSVA